MPTKSESRFLSSNGKNNIYVRKWMPNGEAAGIVQISHGISEHIGRYERFADFLASNGFIVAGNDHLGHGRSVSGEDEFGFFSDTGGWDLVLHDMRRLHHTLLQEHPGLPFFFFGHSMGSFLVRTYIIRYHSGLDGVILSGTGQQFRPLLMGAEIFGEAEVKLKGPKSRLEMLEKLAGKDPASRPKAIAFTDFITRDEEELKKYTEDPLSGHMPTAGLLRDMMEGLRYISSRKNLRRMDMNLPVFFISGDKDPVGENGRGVMRAYMSFLDVGMADLTLKLYHGARHEIINELNRDAVYADVLFWIKSKIK
jgi:alpha-beta hydrolase superfamily lysophospholipase